MSFLSGRGGTEKRLVIKQDDRLLGEDRYQPNQSLRTAGSTSAAEKSVRAQTNHVEAPRMRCGNPACTGSWAKPWKNRTRPIFEEQWGCTSRCLQAIIRGAIRRETGDGIAGFDDAPHRHRVPLGLVMLAKGWITQPQLRRALDGQRAAGGRIGEWLQQDCGIRSETITRGLSMQWNCPVLTTDGFEPQAMALVMPRVFVEELALLPLRIAASRLLYLAFEDRLDASAAFALQKMTNLKVESGLVEASELKWARKRLLECSFVASERVPARDTEQMITQIGEALMDRQPVGARVVRVGRYYWLRMWLESGAHGVAGTVPASVEDMFDTIYRIGS